MKKNKYILALFLFTGIHIGAQQQLKKSEIDSLSEVRRTNAISSINAEELSKNSTPNVSNSLYGLLPGLGVIQQTGWTDNPIFQIRGGGTFNSTPLLIVDGYPRTIDCLNTSEIESITVLKDGAATAAWGHRGANGVISVTTKRGKLGKMTIDAKYNYGMGLVINQPRFVDSYTFALAKNEALTLDGLTPQYTLADLDGFKNGTNKDIYSNTDWLKEGTRNQTYNNQADISFRGGSKNVLYYSQLSYKNDMGVINTDYTNYTGRYDAQMRKYELNFRVNLDVRVTPSTLAKLSMFADLRERNRPRLSDETIFGDLFKTPSAVFPAQTTSGNWGSNLVYKNNPIASIFDNGYNKQNRRLLQSDLRIIQDLSMLVPGLSAEAAIAYDNSATFQETGTKSYAYEVNTVLAGVINSQILGTNSALTISTGGLAEQFINTNLNFKGKFVRSFGKHYINSFIDYRQESLIPLGQSKSYFRQYYTASGSYCYDNRYMVDVLINRSGTSVLPKENRFRTFPSVSAGWNISNESFFKGVDFVDNLKLRASWGKSGFDIFDYYLDQQFWVSGGKFYLTNTTNQTGLTEGTLAISDMSMEMSDKFNIGLDLQLFKKLSFTLDVYKDIRNNILIGGSNLISSALGASVAKVFGGKVETQGLEMGFNWKQESKNFKYNIGGTLSLNKSNVIENGESYKPYSYLSAKGHPLNQIFGLEAIGYFKDNAEIDASPVQTFSAVSPGDIKYKDQNNDNVIDNNDYKAIGNSNNNPALFFGINLGIEYKGFGIDVLFQGVSGFSRLLNTSSVYFPLRNNTNISTWYMEDRIRWTEETKDIANVPRLTTLGNDNNYQTSTQWLVDGSFLKLRNVNLYYNLPKKWIAKMNMDELQIFVRANNVLSIDKVPYLNVEDMGVSYPDMSNFYVGIKVQL